MYNSFKKFHLFNRIVFHVISLRIQMKGKKTRKHLHSKYVCHQGTFFDENFGMYRYMIWKGE